MRQLVEPYPLACNRHVSLTEGATARQWGTDVVESLTLVCGVCCNSITPEVFDSPGHRRSDRLLEQYEASPKHFLLLLQAHVTRLE